MLRTQFRPARRDGALRRKGAADALERGVGDRGSQASHDVNAGLLDVPVDFDARGVDANRVASANSGPVPSPGMRVTSWAMIRSLVPESRKPKVIPRTAGQRTERSSLRSSRHSQSTPRGPNGRAWVGVL